jgi:hypothetical protein
MSLKLVSSFDSAQDFCRKTYAFKIQHHYADGTNPKEVFGIRTAYVQALAAVKLGDYRLVGESESLCVFFKTRQDMDHVNDSVASSLAPRRAYG